MKIEILSGPDKGKIFELLGSKILIIGRDKKCDIAIEDSKSSRKHARFYCEDYHLMVEDLNSTNGTMVNGKIVYKVPLKNNDEITIGSTVLKAFDLPHEDPAVSSNKIFDEHSSTVIITALPHKDADLLAGKSSSHLPEDLLLENERLKKICEISRVISSLPPSGDSVTTILNMIQETLKADTVCLLEWSPSLNDWNIKASAVNLKDSEQLVISRTIIQQALNEGIAIISTNPMTDTRFDPSMSIISEGVSSAICSPLTIKDRFSGVLFIDKRKKDHGFQSIDLRFTATITNVLSLFLEKEYLEIENQKKARLAVIGEVIAGLAHYTKNIITGLRFSINALELVIRKGETSSARKYVKSINTLERRISELVLNMLSYSKDRKPSLERINVSNLIQDIVDPYLNFMDEHGIEFQLIPSAGNPHIKADEQSLHRVCLNLLINAMDSFKTTPKNKIKKITVNLESYPESKEFKIIFKDTGCGIPQMHLDKIFHIFYSTKGSEGTGLGLAVVQKIIQEHRGKISVESKEDEGTIFTITLPNNNPDYNRETENVLK